MAAEAPPMAADPAMEARVMAIAHELRCLVCQNETLAASHSALAVDLRRQIETQLRQGATPSQIRSHMVDRYGQFVLYRPPLTAVTALLWIGPFALLAGAVGWSWAAWSRRATDDPEPELGEADRRRARALLGGSIES
ncbi:MAG: cytochrome c-type biogenesis protein CcmH [Comamonadaceae bacterium]|nr:MAG: cytochrome c-type biogenesis protein CcmH [Comamonadaceae bacterium]